MWPRTSTGVGPGWGIGWQVSGVGAGWEFGCGGYGCRSVDRGVWVGLIEGLMWDVNGGVRVGAWVEV